MKFSLSLILFILLSVLSGTLVKQERAKKDLDPEIRLGVGEFTATVMLAGFRGIAVDVLWIKLSRRQQLQKLYEIPANIDLIVTLQPYFRDVYINLGHEMAVNIPNALRHLQRKEIVSRDRLKRQWEWLYNGLLLAQRGALRLPEDPSLAYQLGFFLMYRLDYDYQTYYDLKGGIKRNFAQEEMKKQGLRPEILACAWFRAASDPKRKDHEYYRGFYEMWPMHAYRRGITNYGDQIKELESYITAQEKKNIAPKSFAELKELKKEYSLFMKLFTIEVIHNLRTKEKQYKENNTNETFGSVLNMRSLKQNYRGKYDKEGEMTELWDAYAKVYDSAKEEGLEKLERVRLKLGLPGLEKVTLLSENIKGIRNLLDLGKKSNEKDIK